MEFPLRNPPPPPPEKQPPLLTHSRIAERQHESFESEYTTVAEQVFGPCLLSSGYFRLHVGIPTYDTCPAVDEEVIWRNDLPPNGYCPVKTSHGELQVWYAGLTIPGCYMPVVEMQGGIMLSNVWLLAKQELNREKLLIQKRAGRQTMEMTQPKLWFYYVCMADGIMQPLRKV